MLFNSLQFFAFFIIVYALYLLLPHKWQNRMLLAASCVFYGSWDWRFLFLLFTTISIDYICAVKIHDSTDDKRRRIFLRISIGANLLFLGSFKYFNFFAENLQGLLAHFGLHAPLFVLNIVLPLGISFYTFEAITYVFDVYRKAALPTRSFSDYALFVIYFPHLIAGPIMRANDLLPQIQNKRVVGPDKFYEGCYLVSWGLFQKICVADNLAKIVDPFFASQPPYNGAQVLLVLYAFAFQIYCDFAGYSNIARGLGKCMGFDIMVNFDLPYFASGARAFWQRWHISLSTFMKDYLYISLGGNRRGQIIAYRNLGITMLLGGLWHGASWTFVLWGAYHAVLVAAERLASSVIRMVRFRPLITGKVWSAVKIIFFFQLVCLGWVFFRAESLHQAGLMLRSLICFRFQAVGALYQTTVGLISAVWFLVAMEIMQYRNNDQLAVFKWHWLLQGIIYSFIIFMIITNGSDGAKEFIYFQF